MSKQLIQISERLYAFFLSFYPKRYTHEFGREMKYVFSESLKDAYNQNKEQGLVFLWYRTFVDGIKSVIRERIEDQKGGVNVKTKSIFKDNKNLPRIFAVTGLILLIPLIAMQFSSDVNWSLSDFVIIGVLLLSVGFAYEVITKKVYGKHNLLVGILLLAALFLVWAELAVGIFGTPFAGS